MSVKLFRVIVGFYNLENLTRKVACKYLLEHWFGLGKPRALDSLLVKWLPEALLVAFQQKQWHVLGAWLASNTKGRRGGNV